MADPQLIYRFAWVLEILGPATIRAASTDLPEPAAVTTLGAFYTKRIKNIDTRIVDGLPNQFYGIRRISGATFVLDNSDQAIDPTADWRGASFTLWHYDREQDVRRTDIQGLVTEVQFANGTATFTFSTIDEALLGDLLPAAVIDPATSSPFEDTASPGVPLPVVFGSDVLIKPPSINVDIAGDGTVSRFDYAAGFGDDIKVSAVWGDWDNARPGLERYGSWETAPGSPAYQTLELDANWRAKHFSVSDDQRVRYQAGLPIRFKTTASGSSYIYSVVKAYLVTGGSHSVEIHDAGLIDSGLNSVQIVGDYLIDRVGYTSVTTGILPEPATAQAITAIRLYGQEDNALLAMVSNPTYPSGSGGTLPSQIIEAIIESNVWGMSTHVQQLADSTTFGAAGVALSLAGLGGSVQGALAYDQRQRSAEVVLDALLMICRGGRLGKNAAGRWTLSVDLLGLSVQDFSHGPGFETGTRIKKVVAYGRAPLDRAVRNLVLHWAPIARTRSSTDTIKPLEYARFSTKAVTGRGADLHIYNPFIRDEQVAAMIVQYMAEKLIGADETLTFVAGQEARDRVAGDVITCTSTVDGFSGDWQVVEVSKSLADVQLTCIRQRDQAFDTPSGVTHSSAPTETPNTRTAPGPGPNLLPNPEPAPPTRLSGDYAQFRGAGGTPIFGGGSDATKQAPHGWVYTNDYLSSGSCSEFVLDKSEAVRTKTKSGHYLRMTWDSVLAGAPIDPTDGDLTFPSPTFNGNGIVSDEFAVSPATDYIVSFYGDAADGWFVTMHEDDPLFYNTILRLTRDSTDTDGNGWTRFYGRWRPKADSTRAIMSVCVSKAGTYNLSSLQVEAVGTSARKPSEWRRHKDTPSVMTRSALINMDGSSTYTSALIKAGEYVLGATIRETGGLGWGTATQLSLGSQLDPDVWARNIREGFAPTTSANYRQGAVAHYYATDTDVLLSFFDDAGAPAAMATGQVRITMRYTIDPPGSTE